MGLAMNSWVHWDLILAMTQNEGLDRQARCTMQSDSVVAVATATAATALSAK